MKSNWFIILGVVGILGIVISVFVFKSSASKDSITIEGCTPYNVNIGKTDQENSVKISWKSKEDCSGYLLYGKEMRGLDMVGVDLKNEVQSKEHEIVLNSLVSSKMYYFTIISNGISYGKEGLPLQFSITSL
ncbi:hypothetical protein GX618_01140 [Candidatus Dojkabacteria bacterium]|jgi:hypothetical protein|uniref:Fibronectin type-III domain-containing protein n=1 Tax=Candidatus Dojkabacteria bacterium TaxID=2099670 RepID=A0A847ESB9_9BACT|nr:hypothetical protein [Candidatus Dojkabacteria bacterium]HRX44174.1 hypothetical protein [Candidatus Dojkabacteria bacterium]